MSTLVSDQTETLWMSPELLHPEGFGLESYRPTEESDRYALGMVIFETLSGQAPYTPNRASANSEGPKRPDGIQGALFTDSVWGMLVLCWASRPDDRPSLDMILRCLQGGTRPSSYMNGV